MYNYVPSSCHWSISRTLPDQHTPRAPNVGITVKTVYKIQTDTFPRRYRGEGILLTKVISIFSACSLMMSGVFTSPAEQKPPIIAPNSPVKSPSFSRFPYGVSTKSPRILWSSPSVVEFYKSQVVYKVLSPVEFISLATKIHPPVEFVAPNWWNLPTELFPSAKSSSNKSQRSSAEKGNRQQNYIHSLSPAEIKESLSSFTNSSPGFSFPILFSSCQGFIFPDKYIAQQYYLCIHHGMGIQIIMS